MIARYRVLLCLLLLLCLACLSPAPAEEASSPALLRNGGSYVIVVREDGSLVGWGDNRLGQLGSGSTKVHLRPIAIAEGIDGRDLRDIQCGNNNTLFLMRNGEVYTCGTYASGTQGLGPLDRNVTTPTRIPTLRQITQVACGFGHNMALDEEGHLWAWGRNDHGQLGLGHQHTVDTPVMLPLEQIVAVQCGGKFTLAQDADGNFYGWGSNAYRVLENSGKGNILSPLLLSGLEGHAFVGFAGGSDMAFWLDDEGALWSRGRNDLKQCGSSQAKKDVSPLLTPVDIPEKVQAIVAYSAVPIALTENGNAYVWGYTVNGQLGNGTAPSTAFPTPGWAAGNCVQVAAGSIFTSLRTADGKIYVSGYNSYGQLGNGTTQKSSSWVWNGTIVFQTGDPAGEAQKALEEAGE